MTNREARTWAEIDPNHLEHNYRALRAMLPAGCRFVGVVKANAYGHGAVPTARKLEEHGRKADVTAARFTVEGMTEAISRDWNRGSEN